MSWPERKARLGTLISNHGDEDAEGLALDRLLHGQTVIGQTARTKEIERLRFSDQDLTVIGTLERGQFGVIHLVTCKLDGHIYVRKSIEKVFAIRNRDHCSPMTERELLLRALQTSTPWSPHLFCAFQTDTHLNLMMDYAEGGSLQDVLESSPLGGHLAQTDIGWWAPQMIAALEWCHNQGFAHRDVKPNNFVVTGTAHLQLIDFGSAAPLLPADDSGVRLLAKEHCLVPCGTCDYIAPEILLAHERALVRLELEADADETTFHTRTRISFEDSDDDEDEDEGEGASGYGAEVDWWSVGVVLYEATYGVAPFFAESVQTTYLRIMDHETSLGFDKSIKVSEKLKDLMKKLLTKAKSRLGRHGSTEIWVHSYFRGAQSHHLHEEAAPGDLHKPEFAYETPLPEPGEEISQSSIEQDTSSAQPVQWSTLFQSTSTSQAAPQGLGSLVQNTPGFKTVLRTPSVMRTPSVTGDQAISFVGFSWGPREGVALLPIPETTGSDKVPETYKPRALNTPRPVRHQATMRATPMSIRAAAGRQVLATPRPLRSAFATPARTWGGNTPAAALLRTGGGADSILKGRTVTEREAMKQLIDCVGMSARKRVLASGRKPRILASELFRQGPLPFVTTTNTTATSGPSGRSRSTSRSGSLSGFSARLDASSLSKTGGSWGRAHSRRLSTSPGPSVRKELRFDETPRFASPTSQGDLQRSEAGTAMHTDTETETDMASAPPSPSPSPRPGSAMSMMSRRSVTPTGTLTGSAVASTFGLASGSSSLRPPVMSIFGNASDTEQSTRRPPSPSAPIIQPVPKGKSRSTKASSRRQPDEEPILAHRSPHQDKSRRVADVTGYDDSRAEAALLWDEMEARHLSLMKHLDSLQSRMNRIKLRSS